jgi:hypothetical protein
MVAPRLFALPDGRPDHDSDDDRDREQAPEHESERAALAGPRPGLGHEGVAVRGRLARELVVTLEHLRFVLDFVLLAHRASLSLSLQSRHRLETPPAYLRVMRILVAASGLFTLLVLLFHF